MANLQIAKIIKYMIILSLLSVFSLPAYSQMSRRNSLELSCVHLYPIMMKYLEKHVNWNSTNQNLENRAIDQFIKKLDSSKLYLLGAEVKKIKRQLSGVFLKTRKKDCSAIENSHALYKKKVVERVEFAKKYLGMKFKFNDKTSVQLDPDKRVRFKTKSAQNEWHKKYIQYQISTYLMSEMDLKEAKEKVIKNYTRMAKRVSDFKQTDLWSWYVDAYARALDPHSSYFSREALEDFEIQMRLSLEGIGATLSSKDGFTTIEQLIPGGAAFRSGQLKRKDKIVSVGQANEGPLKDVIEMDLRDVVRLIRGPKGSTVRLKILRKKDKKKAQNFVVKLVRDKIKLEDEAASITYIDRDISGRKLKIGLLTLPSFYADSRKNGRSSAKDMKKLLAQARKKKVDAVVLDLSNNGGGSLEDAVNGAGLFFKTGGVVKQSLRSPVTSGRVRYELKQDEDDSVDYAGPLVILVSRVAASASEIVSGALKDYKRAIVVGGDHTFGKGTVQSVEYLPPGLGAIKTTVGMFFTAGGNSTQHRGVDSDIVFPSLYSTDEIGEKTLDYSLPPKTIESFVSEGAYVSKGKNSWKKVTPELIKKLNKSSQIRISQNEDFKKVDEKFKKAQKKRGRKIVLAELMKEKEESKKDKDKVKKDKVKKGKAEDEDDDDDGYLTREERKKKYLERADVQEAVNIAADIVLDYQGVKLTLGATTSDPEKEKKSEPAN